MNDAAVQELDHQLSVTMRALNADCEPKRLSYAQELLKRLDNYLKTSTASEYLEEKAHARNYRRQLSALHKTQDHIKEDGGSNSRRDQLLRQTNRIDNSSERLKNIQSMALENERIGGGILNTLRGQRETIQRTKETIAEAEDNVDRSNKTLKTMASWW